MEAKTKGRDHPRPLPHERLMPLATPSVASEKSPTYLRGMAIKTRDEIMAMCKAIRLKNGLTQQQLADELSEIGPSRVHRMSIQLAETDNRSDRDGVRKRILEFGGYEVRELLDVRKK